MNDIVFFYDGIEPIIRVIVVGSLAYFSLLILLRISGKRTLSQLNAFDFVITITIGSAFGRLITAKDVSLVESITAFFTLIFLQYLVSQITVRSPFFDKLITANPSLLYFRGDFIRKTMREQRVTREQLLGSVRENKIDSLEDVEAIVLEATGKIAVIKKKPEEEITNTSALDNIPGVAR